MFIAQLSKYVTYNMVIYPWHIHTCQLLNRKLTEYKYAKGIEVMKEVFIATLEPDKMGIN